MTTTHTRSIPHARPQKSRITGPPKPFPGPQADDRRAQGIGNQVEAPSTPIPRPAAAKYRTPDASSSPSATTGVHPHRTAHSGFTLEKAFTIFGFVVGGLVALLFGIDLALGIPFQRPTLVCDLGFLVSGALLVYLSSDVLRDQRRIGLW